MKTQVLVAASDPEQLDAHCTFLESCGYQVRTASDALNCFRELIEHPPTVLVLQKDLLWGGADGVLARMRDGEHSLSVQVVILGGNETTEALERLLGEPVIACLRNPVRSVDLLKCLIFAEGQQSARALAEKAKTGAARPRSRRQPASQPSM